MPVFVSSLFNAFIQRYLCKVYIFALLL